MTCGQILLAPVINSIITATVLYSPLLTYRRTAGAVARRRNASPPTKILGGQRHFGEPKKIIAKEAERTKVQKDSFDYLVKHMSRATIVYIGK